MSETEARTPNRIASGLREAVNTAQLAARVALIIQSSREEGASATRTAYRILGALDIIKYTEPDALDAPLTGGGEED